MVVRYGRQTKAIEIAGFDDKLNAAIEMIGTRCPQEWQMILDYIDAEALMRDPQGMNELEVVRMAERKQGCAKIFYRLSRIFERR